MGGWEAFGGRAGGREGGREGGSGLDWRVSFWPVRPDPARTTRPAVVCRYSVPNGTAKAARSGVLNTQEGGVSGKPAVSNKLSLPKLPPAPSLSSPSLGPTLPHAPFAHRSRTPSTQWPPRRTKPLARAVACLTTRSSRPSSCCPRKSYASAALWGCWGRLGLGHCCGCTRDCVLGAFKNRQRADLRNAEPMHEQTRQTWGAYRALCEKLAVLHHREFGKFRRLKGRH